TSEKRTPRAGKITNRSVQHTPRRGRSRNGEGDHLGLKKTRSNLSLLDNPEILGLEMLKNRT
ncbi:hypothetical protein PMAYCL1PPCAC_21155, partial [Pristionchus mayeri]